MAFFHAELGELARAAADVEDLHMIFNEPQDDGPERIIGRVFGSAEICLVLAEDGVIIFGGTHLQLFLFLFRFENQQMTCLCEDGFDLFLAMGAIILDSAFTRFHSP